MSSDGLLSVEPQDLRFEFELNKQISCTMQLGNKSDDFVAFKVKTTNPKKYCVRPNTGVVSPHSTFDVVVTMQAQREAPPDLQCRDKFLLQSVVASATATAKDITPDMFNKDSGSRIEETKLKVVFVPPAHPPSPIREEIEGDASPVDSVADNGSYNMTEFRSASKAPAEPQNDLSETRAQLISKLSKDKMSILQENDHLRREMDLLRRQGMRGRGGISFVFVVIVGLLGMLMGYILKKT
uniref:MSP domain-containing protein n=1 Tax=Kalanchoe fedtschenkoi TaxID=63787 RepID=A0A7N0TCP0_KALFE